MTLCDFKMSSFLLYYVACDIQVLWPTVLVNSRQGRQLIHLTSISIFRLDEMLEKYFIEVNFLINFDELKFHTSKSFVVQECIKIRKGGGDFTAHPILLLRL